MGAIPQRGRRLAAPVVAADAQQAAARIVGTHSPASDRRRGLTYCVSAESLELRHARADDRDAGSDRRRAQASSSPDLHRQPIVSARCNSASRNDGGARDARSINRSRLGHLRPLLRNLSRSSAACAPVARFTLGVRPHRRVIVGRTSCRRLPVRGKSRRSGHRRPSSPSSRPKPPQSVPYDAERLQCRGKQCAHARDG